MKRHTWTVAEEENDIRLDHFLVARLEGSRSQIQKQIKMQGVEVGGKKITVPHFFLEAGDVVTTAFDAEEKTITDETPPEINIIHEDDDVLVLNKPAGLLVHSAPGAIGPTLVDALRIHYPKIDEVGEPSRPGIVHRLDRFVSGVMIVAKTQRAYELLKDQFKNHTIEKRYRALVNGRLEKEVGEIRFTIARGPKGRMAARPEENEDGKESVTKYAIRKRYANATELDVEIETGRTHQIRAHFHALGHPIVGDTLYTIRKQRAIAFPRLWLHAESLTIPLLGEAVPHTFNAPLPDKLAEFTKKLHAIN